MASTPTTTPWLFANGIMAEQIRSFDWSSTELGPAETWPDSLRFALDMMLGCAFPATLQWGSNLTLLYNDAYIPLIGQQHPAALGQPIMKAFPGIAETYQPLVDRVWQGERIVLKDQHFQYVRNSAPEDLWFDLSYSPVHDIDGSVTGIFAVGLETTAQVLATRARAAADLRFQRVLETEAVGVIFFDFTGVVIDANEVFLRMIGYTREELESREISWRTLTPPEWVKTSEEQMEKFFETGRIGPYEKEYFHKDGSRRWMLFAGRDLGDGSIAEYAIDITARKMAEESTRSIEKRFRAFVEASSDVIYRVSADWKEMRQWRGHDFLADTELPETTWIEKYIHPDDQELVQTAIQKAIRDRDIFQLEHRVLQADGSIGWTFSRAIPILNDRGEITEWFGTASDITARKLAEEALLRSEKLATLGRLAASIAHEINNPLEATTNLIYLVQNSSGLSAESQHLLELADAELKRVAHITRQSLGFYREDSAPTETSVNELINASVDLLRGKIRTKDARIEREWDEEIKINAVPGELRQVFSNLLSNSLDALAQGGKIKVRVTKSCTADNDSVRITFMDNGRGIPPEARDRIFDPFFSTKGNHGTGLGLWVTKQIVDKHHGSIRMRSRNDGQTTGTAFSVTLPA